jgi:hypothetical protein
LDYGPRLGAIFGLPQPAGYRVFNSGFRHFDRDELQAVAATLTVPPHALCAGANSMFNVLNRSGHGNAVSIPGPNCQPILDNGTANEFNGLALTER